MRVICYYTPAYANSANALIESGRKFDVEVTAFARPTRGSWWENVAYKPHVIYKAITAAPDPLLHVDADCEIAGRLDALPSLLKDYDLLVRHRGGASREPYNSGVMLFANNPKVVSFIRSWGAIVDRYSHRYETGDQGLLTTALESSGLKVGALPVEYNTISSDTSVTPRIVHRKASRENASLSGWKECRRLEMALADVTATLLATTGKRHVYIGGPNGQLPSASDNSEIQAVDRAAKNHLSIAWFSTPEREIMSRDVSNADVRLVSSETTNGNTADYLRQVCRPKPTSLAMPPKLGIYYPAYEAYRHFRWRELCGASVWAAAVQAAVIRKAEQITVAGCPDGLRPQLRDLADDMNTKLEFA